MASYIKALSYYLPQEKLSNEDLVRDFPEWDAAKVSAKVGISCRHIAAANETAGDMAEKAARKLFEEYQLNPLDIDFVLFCTQSPDYFLPSTACILQHKLGISTRCGALDYNLGCSGSIYGLALANGLIVSGAATNVLLLTAETYTKYLHADDKGNRSIFGDAATACLISTDGMYKIGHFALGTDGAGAEALILRTGAARCRNSTGVTDTDDSGHPRRDDYLYMNGNAIFNFTLETVPQLLRQVLKANNLTKESIDYYIFHQANKFMLDSIRKLCRIPEDKFYNNIEQTGNTVSSTVMIALKEAIDSGAITPNQKVLLAGFGVGLSYGACVLY